MKTLVHSLIRYLGIVALLGRVLVLAADAPAPPDAGQPKAGSYRIQPTDKLGISVAGEGDLSVSGKKVDSGGKINLPMLTVDLHVAGLTVKETQAAIENAYRDGRILRYPQVFVNVEEYAPREVNVQGFVKFPGKVQILPETIMTLRDAIIKCGGLNDTANGRKVTVSRTRPDGTTEILEKDVESALLGKKTPTLNDAHFVLEPGDLVYVKERII